MKNRKNAPISFGIMPASIDRTGNANTDPEKRSSAVRRKNSMPGKTEQVSTLEFDFPRMKLPAPDTPFTPDMFTCTSMQKRTFPPPRKISKEEERIHRKLKRLRSRSASHYTSKKSSSLGVSVPWEFFKVVCAGVFLFFKYTFIAVALIITIGCMICAGRQTTGLR